MKQRRLTRKNLIFSFLFILALSLIDAYVHPLLFARSLPFPTPVSAVVEALLFFGSGILLCLLFSWLRSRTWPEVRTLDIEKLASLYILLVTVYSLLLLRFNGLDGFTVYTITALGLAALSSPLYVLVKDKKPYRDIWKVQKGFEVFLQVLIPLIAIEILSTLYMNMVSSPTPMIVVYILSWGLACGLAFGMGLGILLGIGYYGIRYRLGLAG